MHRSAYILWILLVAALPAAIHADDFPPITEAERSLSSVDWEPGASAVVLYRNAELRFRDYAREANSRLLVEQRVKILTEEGVEAGVREITHSRFLRLGDIEARTVTPDGRAVAVPEDAIFTERRSKTSRLYVTKVAFPSVTPGAILDLRFEIFWDSFYYLDPWLFHQDIPVLHSKISYIKPDNLTVNTWGRQTGPQEFLVESSKAPGGMRIDVAMENLGALPNEPYSFPDIDLSSRFMIVPTRIFYSGSRVNLLSDWGNVCETFEEDVFVEFMKNQRRDVRKTARSLTQGITDPKAQIAKIFAFVRDDIATEDSLGVFIGRDIDAGDVLKSRSGSPAEKVLLLRALLDAMKIEGVPLWVADSTEGGVVPDVPNPAWFSGTILQVEGPDRPIYLDPSDRGNGVGTLVPYLEGTLAVDCNRKKDVAFSLPGRRPETNQRTARIRLSLDEEGRFSGEGAILLEGHTAWRRLGLYEDNEAAVEGWHERLTGRLPGFLVNDLTVEEDVETQQVVLRYKLEQREEDVLGDEASLAPSKPLDQSQPFSLPVEKRRTPVLMPFGYSDQLVLEVTWPEGWSPDVLPKDSQHGGAAGSYGAKITVDEANRALRYERNFSLAKSRFLGDDDYAALRSLFEAASKSDVQEIVWLLQ